jgi:hypothetical protein
MNICGLHVWLAQQVRNFNRYATKPFVLTDNQFKGQPTFGLNKTVQKLVDKLGNFVLLRLFCSRPKTLELEIKVLLLCSAFDGYCLT